MNHILEKLEGSRSAGLMEKAQQLKAEGKSIISLAGGEPDFDTPAKISMAAVRALSEGETHYAVGPGILPLRQRICQKLREENGIDTEPDRIIVTPGAKFAVYLAARALLNPGDEVLVLNPGWVSYASIVIAAGGVPIPVELDAAAGYEITEEKIASALTEKTKMIIVNTPNNPTGRMLTEAEADVLEAAAKKWDLVILADEIYEKIIFSGKRHISLAARDTLRERVVTVNGFSKAFAMTGWRLGYLDAPAEMVKVMKKLYSHTITGCPTFLQTAAVTAFDCLKDVEAMRVIYERRRNTFLGALNGLPGVHAEFPEGAFYAWVRFDGKSGEDMAVFLMEKAGVIGVPGSAYAGTGTNYMRFSFAVKDEELAEALRRIQAVL